MSITKVNSSDFLVKTDALSKHQHIRVTNDSFFRKSEPFPIYEFSEFRKNEFYIKVNGLSIFKRDRSMNHVNGLLMFKRNVNHDSVLCNVAASFLQYSSTSCRPRLF